MRLLLYGINYSPELTGVGKYTGEMATWLAERGHDVRVVTAPAYYPEWRIHRGFRNWWTTKFEGRIRVTRCPLWVPAKPRGITRMLHLASFAASSIPAMLRQVAWRPDVVWTVEPTLLCTPTAWIAARLSGAAAWLHIQDFELDAARELGLLSAGKAHGIALRGERALMRRFCRVSTLSPRMLDRLKAKGISTGALFPNWVDTQDVHPMSTASVMRAELGIRDDEVVCLYSGSMGAKQGLETLADAARALASRCPKVRMVFSGEGPGRDPLETLCDGLANVRFLNLQPAARLNQLLNLADIHVLPQRAGAADLVMPSKLAGMLASGRPVVATAMPETEVARVVEGRGIVVRPGQTSMMVDAIARLADDRELRRELGHEARSYAVAHLEKDTVLAAFEQQLLTLCSRA
jgi:colanic acid biosynthesis glycosyl transferase WcaI